MILESVMNGLLAMGRPGNLRILLLSAAISMIAVLLVAGVMGAQAVEWMEGILLRQNWPEWIRVVLGGAWNLLVILLALVVLLPAFRWVSQGVIMTFGEYEVRKLTVEELGFPDYAGQSSLLRQWAQLIRPVLTTLRYHGLFLPLYLILLWIPPIALVGFWILDGLRAGREYFEMMGPYVGINESSGDVWRQKRLTFWVWGTLISMLLTVPILNFAVPLFATYSMVYLLRDMKDI